MITRGNPKYLHAQFSGRNNHNRLDSCSCWHNLGKYGKKICQCLSRACLLSHPILTSGRSQLDTFITDREITKMGIKPQLVFPVSILHPACNWEKTSVTLWGGPHNPPYSLQHSHLSLEKSTFDHICSILWQHYTLNLKPFWSQYIFSSVSDSLTNTSKEGNSTFICTFFL